MELKVVKAIADGDLEELERLIKISDFLHKGVPEYEGYTQDDMLTDMKYEEAVSYLKEQRKLLIAINSKKEVKDNETNIKANKNTLMFMDGIQIVDTIPTINHAILMPKFDGCSVGCEIVKTTDGFVLTKAHTRGADDLNGNRQCQDKTTYLQAITTKMIENINSIVNNNEIDLNITIKHKNTNILGNENKPLKSIIDLHNLDYLLIRGEFVSNDKTNSSNEQLPSTAVGLAAGALNGKEDKFNEYKNYITYIPFEIALLKIYDEDTDISTEFIPTQESTIKILYKLKMIEYKICKVPIDATFNMEAALQTFESMLKQPLDGVVYCNRNWTYPMAVEETSKRVNYGKYKWKRHNVKQTKLIDIEYSIGKTGKLTPSLIFNTTNINGKNYKKAKTTFNHIQEFIDLCKQHDKSFGVGLVCELELMSDISPQITKIYPQVSHIDKAISLIDICPYCGNKLTTEDKVVAKQRVINISCDNDNCCGVLAQKCSDFLKQIGYKGISNKTLENIKFTNFQQLYDNKLRTVYKEVGKKSDIIYSSKSVNKLKTKIEFDDIMKTINIKTFLVSISLFTKQKATSFIKQMKINDYDNLIDNINTNRYKDVREYLLNKTNYFINDLTKFIISNYTK